MIFLINNLFVVFIYLFCVFILYIFSYLSMYFYLFIYLFAYLFIYLFKGGLVLWLIFILYEW